MSTTQRVIARISVAFFFVAFALVMVSMATGPVAGPITAGIAASFLGLCASLVIGAAVAKVEERRARQIA